jgi:hypothetical protein
LKRRKKWKKRLWKKKEEKIGKIEEEMKRKRVAGP